MPIGVVGDGAGEVARVGTLLDLEAAVAASRAPGHAAASVSSSNSGIPKVEGEDDTEDDDDHNQGGVHQNVPIALAGGVGGVLHIGV
eukprot:scaffold10374_cov121-Isochrysis_galbana.AAC.1